MQEHFEVDLVRLDGQQLPKVTDRSGQTWVVGEPGDEFAVRVRAQLPAMCDYLVTAKVDGQGPGYSLIMHANPLNRVVETAFTGWLQGTGGAAAAGHMPTTYKAFRLGKCAPSEDAAQVQTLDEIKAGRIELQVERVVACGLGQPFNAVAAGPSSEVNKRLPEGKKAFLAPGLRAEAGSVKVENTNWNSTDYQTVGSLDPIKLRYDSSEALLMRRILNPKLPAHRAILRNSSNPVVRNAMPPLENEDAAAASAADRRARQMAAAAAAAGGGAGAAGPRGRVKREPRQCAGVKRERDEAEGEGDDGEFVPGSATADKIDLTEEPTKPLVVNGRTLAADELAVCDLADSDDEEGPKWGVQKKQQIDLEETVA